MQRLALVLACLAGCVDPAVDDGAVAAASSVGPTGRIAFQGGGQWFRPLGCPSPDPSTCHREASFWVDLAVRNDAFQKRVGIVWIDTVRDDPAQPWRVSEARYEGPLDPPYERWGIDVAYRVLDGIEPNPQIRLAAFVEMNGATSWDNHGGADYILP